MRYAAEIAELRDFLAKSGLGLDTAETLPRMSARLHADRAFRRDLTSHLWVVIHAGEQTVRHADLLAMLAVAAAGPHFAADAADREAHDLLRFVMQVWGSFANVDLPAARPAAPVASAPPRLPESDAAPLSFMRAAQVPQHEAALSLAIPEDAGSQRRMLWIGAAACGALLLLLGLLLHPHAPAKPVAPIPPTSAPLAETLPPQALANREQGQPTQPRSETPIAATRRTPLATPYSLVPESSQDMHAAGGANRAKPSPAIPMAPSRPTVAAVRPLPRPYAHSPRTSPPAQPASVAAGDSSYVPKAVPVDALRLRGSGTSAGTTRQAIVRPTSLGIMAANVTYSPAPAYPASAAAARVQGEVKLEAEVGRDGTVESTRIISGPPLLADAAVNAVQHWRYRPYLYEGKPIAMNAQIVMDFQLP
jgi:TonB family protein